MAIASDFRTCPTTGLKVHLPAEKLIKANAVAAVVFLAIGGLFGLLVALTRAPWAARLLPADWFYLALTAHGLDVLITEFQRFDDKVGMYIFQTAWCAPVPIWIALSNIYSGQVKGCPAINIEWHCLDEDDDTDGEGYQIEEVANA